MDATMSTNPTPTLRPRVRATDLDELLTADRGPAISLFLEAADPGEDPHAERLRVQEALAWASRITKDGALEDAIPDTILRRGGGEGLASFRSPGRSIAFHAPEGFQRRIVIGEEFHLLPLIRLLQTPSRFWVLFLSQKDVRLWEGRRGGLRLVEDADLPGSMEEALDYGFERDDAIVITRKQSSGRHGEHGRGGTMPVFHGHGVGPDDQEAELKTFYRAVAKGLERTIGDDGGPIILAGVKEHHAAFREVASLRELADRGIEASVRDWSSERIHEAAWPIVARMARARIEDASRLWNAAPGDKRETDPAGLARQAVAGRIRILMLEHGRELAGTVDPATGEVALGWDVTESPPSARGPDILNALATHVLRRRGEVLIVDPEDMPVDTGAAGLLR